MRAPVTRDYALSSHPKGGLYVLYANEAVELDDYFGKLLWVDYAAEWCSYCDRQARTLRSLERKYAGEVDFLTVVTGTAQVMEPPTATTARAWASRYRLEPQQVIARFSTDRLPLNLFYAPDGSLLFSHSGLMSQRQVEDVLRTHGASAAGKPRR